MTLVRTFLLAFGLGLPLLSPMSSAAPPSAKESLALFDQTTASGYLTLLVSQYAPPSGKGNGAGPAVQTQATLLFDRPDLFRFVLNPGEKNEFRAVGDGEIVRWLDLATGVFGKSEADKVAEPIALALLGTAGELGRLASSEELDLGKGAKLSGARVLPRVYGSAIAEATAFFHEGQPTGFRFEMHDGSRMFVAVLGFTPNVKTSPKDFDL